MANFAYTEAKQLGLTGVLDLQSSGLDVRVLLVMTNTTADTEEDVTTLNGFTTLDEYDDVGYARQSTAGETVTKDNANNRSEWGHNVVTFPGLGVGTRQAQAHIYYSHVTNDTDSPPLFYVDTGGYPFDGNGGDVTITPNAEGAAQLT